MKQYPIYDSNTPAVANILKQKKYKIADPLTDQLVKSLVTKIVYTLAHYKIFEEWSGTISLDGVTVTPYTSIVGDIRYIFELDGLQYNPIIVQWNGKINPARNSKHSGIYINVKNFNVTEDLDRFVEFEQRVVAKLHAIEDHFFSVQKVQTSEGLAEIINEAQDGNN